MNTMLARALWILLSFVVSSHDSSAAAAQDGYPLRAPFTAVRFDGDTPRVEVEGVFYELLELDGHAASDLVEFCKRTYGRKWAKRFGEDLVQVLSELGSPPGDAVDLELRTLDGMETLSKPGVAMTLENRQAVLKNNRGDSNAATPVGPVRRVERKHARRIPREWKHLVPAWLEEPPAGWSSPRLTREQAEQDLDQLEWLLEDRFSYLDWKGIEHRAALDALRIGCEDGVEHSAFALMVVRFLALFGDGHTRVTDSFSRIVPRGSSSFLLEETPDGIACFHADRSGFLAPDLPYLEAIDGIDVEDWIAAARVASSGYSPQFSRRQAIRNLRYIGWVAMELGEELGRELTLTLTDGRDSMDRVVPVTSSRGAYGSWPRTSTGLLEGDVGYLRIPSMESERAFLEGLRSALDDFADTKGLVIDVRGNGGGSRDALRVLLPYFLEPDHAPVVVNVAYYRMRDGDPAGAADGYLSNRALFPAGWSGWSPEQRRAIESFQRRFQPAWKLPFAKFSEPHFMLLGPGSDGRTYHYAAPVKLLIDGDCFSATDVFASAFKGLDGVELVGTRTGGGSGRSQGVTLAHSGLSLRLSSMASFQKTGELYDGTGVAPDVVVEPRATDFIGETDTVLEAALARF